MRLIDNWGSELHRLWSIRFSIGFAVFTGVATALAGFGEVLNPYFLLVLCVVVNLVLLPLARLAKQEAPDGQ